MAFTLVTSKELNGVESTWSVNNQSVMNAVLSGQSGSWTVSSSIQKDYFYSYSNDLCLIPFETGTYDFGNGLYVIVSSSENSLNLDIYLNGTIIGGMHPYTTTYDYGGNTTIFFTEDETEQVARIMSLSFGYIVRTDKNACSCKQLTSAWSSELYNWLHYTTPAYTSNGGGATHIAKVTGQLKDLSSNLSDILMVSGGGGGGLIIGDTEYSGKEAGGISGSGDNSADQSTGNAFGQGESGTNVSGGGSGLYGGYKGTSAKSGGAGSGYIGNSLLSNKKMVGYNVPTSDVERYKTETTNEFSAIAQANKPKIGNGHVRIKFLWDEGDDDMHTYSESEHRVGTWTNGKPVYERVVTVNEFAGTNNQWINTGVNIPNGEEIVFVGFAQAHALSDGFLFNCFAKFDENKNVLAYFATGTYTYYYSRCFIQYTKTTD